MMMLLASIAAVALLVAGIGIMNIMLASVTGRMREIGIRMAVGAKGREILTQFLLEAVVLSTIGGIVGVGLGGSTLAVAAADLTSNALTAHLLKPRMRTPPPTRRIPNHSLIVGRSWRKTVAKTATNRRLNLSTGATFDASPTFKARK